MVETKMFNLADLKVSRHNMRTTGLDRGIENLMESIKSLGLLEPITVIRDESGNHTILLGQRRFHAYNKLNERFPGQGYDRIECIVRDPYDEDVSKAVSFSENATHVQMPRDNMIEAASYLFNESGGTYGAVMEKYGLTRYMVDKYVGISRLHPKIRDAIKKGDIHPTQKTAETLALKAAKSLGYVPQGDASEEKVIEFARLLGNKDEDRNLLLREARKHPHRTIEQIVDGAGRRRKIPLNIHLDVEQDSMLAAYTDRHLYDTKEDAAIDIITDRLQDEEGEDD